MTAEQITVSLVWAKKLKQAGWPHLDSINTWYPPNGCADWELNRGGSWKTDGVQPLAAPTAEEILRRLPPEVEKKIGHRFNTRVAALKEWEYGLHDTLADAVAAMWVYLAENGLLPKP